MADTPSDRRRADKTGKPSRTSKVDEPSATDSQEESRPATPPGADGGKRWTFQANVAWALVTGLAVGFAVGREAHRFGLSDGREAADDGAKSAFIAAESNAGDTGGSGKKAYKSSAEFPAGWVKDTDLANGATLFAGLNDQQKTTVMQALNERNCTCGCTFGTLAECLHKDPNCPNSPAITKMLVEQIKQGKTLDQLLTAIDERQKGNQKPAAAPEVPEGPKYVEVAAWNVKKGPKDPKVTIIEFSDFQ